MTNPIDQATSEATQSTETVGEPRKPITLQRQVVRLIKVQSGIAAGKGCVVMSRPH